MEKESNDHEISPHIKRLIWLNNLAKKEFKNPDKTQVLESIYFQAESYREKTSCKYPAKIVLLVEGATEEKLLPIFAEKLGVDLDKTGVQLIAAGGKNQVIRLYKKLYKRLNLPILILLDADASLIADGIREFQREEDRILVIQRGEFEDILPINLIHRTINTFHRLTTQVTKQELEIDMPMTSLLDNLWKEKGLGEYDKVKFARIVAENIRDEKDISPELHQIISTISEMLSN